MAASPAIYSCPGLMRVTGLTVGNDFSLVVAEPDVAEQVERYGAGLTLLEWAGQDKAKRPLFGGRQVHQRQRRGMGECLAPTPILSIWRPRGWPHERDLTPRPLRECEGVHACSKLWRASTSTARSAVNEVEHHQAKPGCLLTSQALLEVPDLCQPGRLHGFAVAAQCCPVLFGD
jgi:hypothetical protein